MSDNFIVNDFDGHKRVALGSIGQRRVDEPGPQIASVTAVEANALFKWEPSNAPPVANAGPDQTVFDADASGNEDVTLDGSGSTDPDGNDTIIQYSWTWAGGSALGVNPTVNLPVGVTVVTLAITDMFGEESTDTVTITVQANQSPVADAGPDQMVTDLNDSNDEQITLDGSGSFDPDGESITNYLWTWDDGGPQSTTGVNPTITLPIGTTLVTLQVTNSIGQQSTDNVTIVVLANIAVGNTTMIAMSGASVAGDGKTVTTGLGSYFGAKGDFGRDAGDGGVFQIEAAYVSGSARVQFGFVHPLSGWTVSALAVAGGGITWEPTYVCRGGLRQSHVVNGSIPSASSGVWGIVIDFDNGTMKGYHNGTLRMTATLKADRIQPGDVWFPAIGDGQSAPNVTMTVRTTAAEMQYPIAGANPWDGV